ncbi:MAG: FAA hydrolase family protein, partial [Thaumarchaeota archaeon]
MKIGRIKIEEVGETYGIISPDGKSIITKLDFQEQTGVPIPQTIKEFIVRGWIDEVKKYLNDLNF